MNCNPPSRGPLSGDRDMPQPNLPAQSRRRPIGSLLPPRELGVVSTAGLLSASDFDSHLFSTAAFSSDYDRNADDTLEA